MLVVRLLAFFALALSASTAQADCNVGAAGRTERVEVPGTGRSLNIYRPVTSSGRKVPLMFLLHGSGGTGRAVLGQSGLTATADKHGFIVAAPDGGIAAAGGFVWNIPGVPAVGGRMPTAADADDTAFIGKTIDWLVGQGCVDRARVYSTGISGGGRMSSWLACATPERFAAIAPVVGLRSGTPLASDPKRPDPQSCRPSRPVPIIAFAGDKDTVNPIEGGGTPYWQYPMRAAEERWAELNGCRAGPVRRQLKADIYEDRWSRCRGGAEVVGVITVGGGHVWLADNEAMWAFLSRYRR